MRNNNSSNKIHQNQEKKELKHHLMDQRAKIKIKNLTSIGQRRQLLLL